MCRALRSLFGIAAVAALPRATITSMNVGARATRSGATTVALAARSSSSTPPAKKMPAKKKREEVAAPSSTSTESNPARKRRASSPPPLAEPDGWRGTWDLIYELRADRTAVVDSMGTEAISAEGEVSDAEREYQTLISLMLSSQTKDTVNMATMLKLRAHGCTVENILATPDETLHELIRAVGFHNNKLKFIKETTTILEEKHGGRVPDDMPSLLELPGVGPKMALILLSVCFGKIAGISVDTHVHRICNQLGWTGTDGTKQPEQTRRAIESWMPRDVWPEVNLVLVGLGQEVQTEKAKLLRKCAVSSEPERAFRLMATLGVDVPKEAKKAGLALPGLEVD